MNLDTIPSYKEPFRGFRLSLQIWLPPDRSQRMIAIEYAPASHPPYKAQIRRRDLSRFLAEATDAVGLPGKIDVLLAGDDRLRALNRSFRGLNRPTDVLSFPVPADQSIGNHSGDLAISIETACRQADIYGHSLQTEIKILILHGILHLAGEDHESDSGRMRRREARLRRKFGLPIGLIERAQPAHGRTKSSGVALRGSAKRNRRQTASESKSR